MIILTEELFKNLISLLGVLLGGGFAGHWIAGKKNTNDDKQEIINQLQEERAYFSEQLRIRDVKIDELYEKFRELEKSNNKVHQEKAQVEWELEKQIATNVLLAKEKEAVELEKELVEEQKRLIEEEKNQLLMRVSRLELRVNELERGE